MLVEVKKSELLGKMKAPSSKSYTHRALILSALAKGKSRIFNPLICDDTIATLNCLEKIGIRIKKKKEFWEIEGGNLKSPKEILFCKESGTTFRLIIGVCSLIKGRCILSGESSLLKRPILPLLSALRKLGVKCKKEKNKIILENNFLGGKTKIRGDISSQFISALLLISPFCQKEVEILLTTPLESTPYLLITLEMQNEFGVKIECSKDLRTFKIKRQNYRNRDYFIEGDWSSASPFLVGGAIAGRVEIKGLNFESIQADKKIIEVLKKAGAGVIIKNGKIKVKRSSLRAFSFNVKDCPDLFPIICVLASRAEGESEISGIRRLKFKESNRLEEMRKGLKRMGIGVRKRGDSFFVRGGIAKGGEIETKDHRIAMAFSILGLVSEKKIVIKNGECVVKSYPNYWEELKKLKAHIKIEDGK